MREVLGIVSAVVPVVSPVLLSGSVAFGAPCPAGLALVIISYGKSVKAGIISSTIFSDKV